MIKKISKLVFLLIIIVSSTVVSAEEINYIEIFDPAQDRVVKIVQLNPEIYNMVVSWVKNINGFYGKIDPITDDGYAIKIPFEPAIKINGDYLNALVDKVYIIIPENDPPFFMIFENEDKPICFPFNGNIETLSKALDFKLNRSHIQ